MNSCEQISPKQQGFLSMDEIIRLGLSYRKTPKTTPCKFCKKLIEPEGIVFDGEVVNWRTGECLCHEAREVSADKRRRVLSIQRQSWAKRQEGIEQQETVRIEFGLSELKAKKYPLDPATTPTPFVCEFCQKEIDPVAFVALGLVIWQPTFCDCEKGEAKKQAVIAEGERAEAEKKQRELDEKVRELLSKSGIKSRFMTRTFQNFKTDTDERKKAFGNAKYYAENFVQRFLKAGTGLYIEGTFGTGKTHLAVAIALHLIQNGVSVICKTSIDLLSDIKESFKYGGEGDETYRYKACTLLVIDDLGKEQSTEWSLAKLYEIINDRYEKCKPTVITTNYSHSELVGRLVAKDGDKVTAGALVSRLKEAAIVMNMVWEDQRGQ